MSRLRYILSILSIALLAFTVSCSAEMVDSLDAVTSIRADGNATFIVEEGGVVLRVRFSPVPYAKLYAYEITDGEFTIISSLTYMDGLNVISISGLDVTKGTISLYASLDPHAVARDGSWTLISSSPFSLGLWQMPPDAYLSKRDGNSALIMVNAASSSMIYYGALLDADGNQIRSLHFTESSYTVDNLDHNSSYTIELSHVDPDTGKLGDECTISIPKYESSMDTSMSISVTDTGFEVHDVPRGTTSVSLCKAATYNGTSTELAQASVTNGSAVVPFSDLQSLESGYFHFEAGDYRSNILKYTTSPLATKVDPSWKSVTVLVDFASDFSADNYSISLYGAPSASLSMLTDGSGFTISGLDSNTTYDGIGIQFLDNTGSKRMYRLEVPSFTTKSFAGITYSWKGSLTPSKNTNYVITVTPAPEGSIYPYYVYFDESDEVFLSEAYTETRIMPVIDNSVGEPQPTSGDPVTVSSGYTRSGLDLTVQNAAYLLNSSKWNSMGVTPNSWYVATADSNTAKDIVTTTTSSRAMGMNNTTTTSFYFNERVLSDGSIQPYIMFENLPGSNLVAMGLYKNANPQTGFGTLANPNYTWILTPVVEGK